MPVRISLDRPEASSRRRSLVPRRTKGKKQQEIPAHLIDTNVILRFLIGDDQPKAARATALMERVERAEEWIELPDEVLTETVWTLESYYQVPRRETADKLTALLSFPGVRSNSPSILLQELQLYAFSHADFVDCLLAARARDRGIPVYTFDESDFKRLAVPWEKP
jgi:predicted nucleic acid-binding protein